MGVKITSDFFGDIPFLIYEGDSAKRLLFLQHGIYGSKEQTMKLLGVRIANLGYKVVAIDARMHGERKEYPFDEKRPPHGELKMPDIIEPTAKDILTLFYQYFTNEKTFDYMGISMGGIIGFHLLSQTNAISHFYGVITTPDYLAFEPEQEAPIKKENPEAYEHARNVLTRLNPVDHMSDWHYQTIDMFHGVSDETVPLKGVKQFYKNNPSDKITLKTYQTDHRITPEMFDDILKQLKRHNQTLSV